MNHRVDIREDNIKKLSVMHQARYMLPSDMSLSIRSGTVLYNNKILVSDGGRSLGRNDKVNALESETLKHTPMTNDVHNEVLTEVKSHKNLLQTIIHKDQPTITHEEERAALILFLTGGHSMVHVLIENVFI